MVGHTPGPWGDVHGIIQATNKYIIARIDAPIHLHNETTEANARLIAAAPDLLAALRAVIPALIILGDHIGNEFKGGNGQPAFDRCALIGAARAAIAKAEGTS